VSGDSENWFCASDGVVERVLSDDNTGSRHQRFILRLDSGHHVLVAHNIDRAPRLRALKLGDRVAFFGEYLLADQEKQYSNSEEI